MKKGTKHSEKAKEMNRVAHLGIIPWHKGKTGVYSKKVLMGWSEIKKGKKLSPETREKIRIAGLGKKHSIESRKKMSEGRRGQKNPMFGKHPSLETRKKRSESCIANPNRKFKDTGIEIKMEEALQILKIPYIKQKPLHNIAIVDFYLPEVDTVIQCDGCYYHNCLIHYPNGKIGRIGKDFDQDLVLTSHGTAVYRFWEHEINESAANCIKKIKELA
jgi:very-short-patch-repair endonuclease